MKITVVQTDPIFLNPTANLQNIEKTIARLTSDLIILPELCTSGYNFKNKNELRRVAEDAITGPTLTCLRKIVQTSPCAIVAGFPEKSRGLFFNSSMLVTKKNVHIYRKTHLFLNEKRIFSKGNTGFPVIRWQGIRIGMMICFDWFFPESMRTLALKGADIVVHPSNLVLPYAPTSMKTRSLENHVFSATANRIGQERGLKFCGQSQILGPKGETLVSVKGNNTGCATATINPKKARNKLLTPLNNIITDRVTQFYFK